MNLRIDFNLLPHIQPDEKVLCVKKWLWAASFKSLPTYRFFFSLPPIMESGIYVTDRRLLKVLYIFRILSIEMSIWFPGYATAEKDETMRSVTIDEMPVFGRYLEIISEDSIKRWYRSRQLRIRLFLRDPQPICGLISQAIEESIKQ